MLIIFVPILSSFVFAFNLQGIIGKSIAYDHESSILRIPSPRESAILARRILRLTPIGTFSTIFPSSFDLKSTSEQPPSVSLHPNPHRPQGLEGTPIGLIDYVADCEASGNPTVLAIKIATTFKNAGAGSNVSVSFSWTPPNSPSSRLSLITQRFDYPALSLPRFSLSGYFERISDADVERLSIQKCFLKLHPDAKYWLPGNQIHASEWQRFVVQQVYWVGGFGDRAYIGWIPIDLWKGVRQEEIDRISLPGE